MSRTSPPRRPSDRHAPSTRRRTAPAGPGKPTARAAASPVASQKTTSFSRLVEAGQREVVVASFWSETGLPEDATSAVVRIRGRRTGVTGKPQARDQFVREEVIELLPPGAGPFSITTKAADVNPGDWLVDAEIVSRRAARTGGPRSRERDRPVKLELASWSWRRWSLSSAPEGPVRTALSAWARRPGIVRAGWPAMVALGIALALVTQVLLVRREGLDVGDTLTVTALAIIAGAIGAKAWYVILKRRERRWDGWCIQGFVLAVILVALVVVPLVDLPLGVFLDLTTPPLFLGMGTGRIGCLLAGCCGGRPTCSRFGIWSSDRRLGVRRVPTQLLEAGLAFTVAASALAVVTWGSRGGAPGGLLFVAALAGYTLCRQGLLRFRAEGRRTSVGSRLTGVTAGIVLAAAGAALVLA